MLFIPRFNDHTQPFQSETCDELQTGSGHSNNKAPPIPLQQKHVYAAAEVLPWFKHFSLAYQIMQQGGGRTKRSSCTICQEFWAMDECFMRPSVACNKHDAAQCS